jgi:hypothetical protein
MGSPQLDTTARYLPLHFSLPETMMLRRPRPPSVPTAAAYKRPPFLAEKIHTIPSYLPEILLSLLALSIELSGVGHAPSTSHVPGISGALPTRRLLRVAETNLLRRQDTPAVAVPRSGELPNHHRLPAISPASVRVEAEKTASGRRIRS